MNEETNMNYSTQEDFVNDSMGTDGSKTMEAKEYYNKRLKEDSTIGTVQLMEEYANTKAIKWIPIDKENLPDGLNLIMNINGIHEVGMIRYDDYGEIYCQAENTKLYDPTHFIDINKIQL